MIGVPTVPVCVPGLVIVMVFTVPVSIVQLNVAVPDAPVVSVTVTITVKVPSVVVVPLIRPVEELIDRPVGSPVAE